MEILQLKDGVEGCVLQAYDALKTGGVIVYPTDTLYGLGADALSDTAVAKVRAIKGQDEQKPIHAVVADLAMAGRYAEVSDTAMQLAEKYLPGPLTMILKKKEGIETGIARGFDTFAIRIPDNQFCLNLARMFDGPFTTTSANRHGAEPCLSIEAILAQLGDSAEMIDVVIDAGSMSVLQVSTIVDISAGHTQVVRKGSLDIS